MTNKLIVARKENIADGSLQLSPIKLNEEYCKEWNEHMGDFVVLIKNGELISDSLYRVGGFGADIKQDYFVLLKYVEAIYDFEFIKNCYPNKSKKENELQRKHLESRWCIIDKNGVEIREFDQFKTPYITKGSCIYSLDNYYYNIETGNLYCRSFSSMASTNYLFLNNDYDDDKDKRGVMKINKKDGTFELFP